MPQGLPGFRTPAGRAAVVTALCAAAAVGLQARGALSNTADAWAPRVGVAAFYDASAVVMGVAVVQAAVLLTLWTRMRRRRRKGKPGRAPSVLELPWWVRMLALLFELVLIGLLAALIILGHRGEGGGPSGRLVDSLPPLFGNAHGQAAGVNASALAGMVLAVAALAVTAVLARRGRPRSTELPGTAADAGEETQLRAAVSAGAGALHDEASPQAAIIACYTAMERSLTRAGAAPADADTPDEVLTRAAGGGLIRSGAAAELTGLFRRARYGGREMTEADRAAALGALAHLSADLDGAS